MGSSSYSSSSIYVYSANSVYPLRLYQFGTIVWLLILLQTEYKCLVAAQGNQGGNSNLRQGPYSPIQNIFFGPLLPRDDRRPIQQRGHNAHQPQQQQQQPLHQQNSKSSIPSNAEIIIPPPPPPPVPSRAPKSIGEQQLQDSPTTQASPSAAPGTTENGGSNRNPVASGPGRPSPNPGLHLTPNTEHLAHNHHPQQQPSLQQRNKKFRKNPLRKRPPGQLPSRRLPPPRHRPPIHHPRLRGPPRNGPIPHPPKSINELGKKKKTGPPNKLSVGARNPPPPPPPPRGTPPTPTVRTQSGADQQQLFRSPGVTPPYGSTTGVIPTATSPQLRDSVSQNAEEAHHSHHHGPHPPGFSTSHVQPPLRNPIHQERPRRPIPTTINNRPHHNNDHRSHQHHPTVQESLTPDGSHNHNHDHSNVLPPPPPPIPVIVDQLNRDIPIPDTLLDQLHSPESHHHPPPQTNTLNIPQQQNPLHETEAPQNLLEQRDEANNHQQHNQPQQHHQMISEDHVKQLEELTGISLTRLPLSHEPLQSIHDEHHQQNRLSHHDLPNPSPFQQQQVVLDPPSNALYVDTQLSSEEEDHHNHHDHHKDHKLENYHLPDDVLLKISPRGHSSGPVIISQVPVKSFQSADVHLSVKEPMPEKNKYPKTIDAVPATSLAGSGAAVAQLLSAEARPSSSNNLEAQSRSDDSSFFYFSQPSDLSASDSEVSSQVAFNSQRIKTKDESVNVEKSNHQRRERNGTPRQLNHVDDGHHSNNSEDQDISTGHNHNHDHNDEDVKGNRRIDNEIVRELVDCGGSDLGFCDMNSRYPGHMMGNLMSDCQELVYKGFVPVPEDLEELGDNGPLARYSNASKSAVRARAGSWSWKPYTYKKKQICDSELRFIRPGYARDATGKWQVIVQTESLPQRVAIDLCHSPEKPCSLLSDCGRKSRCIQRYTFQHLLAVDPDNLHDCPTIRAFKFPAACVCHIEFPDYHSEFF